MRYRASKTIEFEAKLAAEITVYWKERGYAEIELQIVEHTNTTRLDKTIIAIGVRSNMIGGMPLGACDMLPVIANRKADLPEGRVWSTGPSWGARKS